METQIRCACGTSIPIGDIPPGTSVPCPGCGKPFFRAGGRETRPGKPWIVVAVLCLVFGVGSIFTIVAVVAMTRAPSDPGNAHGLDAVNRIGIAQQNYLTSFSAQDDPERAAHYWGFDVAGLHYAPTLDDRFRNLIPRELADADATEATKWTGQPASPVPYHGYLVRLIPLPRGAVDMPDLGFAVCAYPATADGRLTFIRDHHGLTFAKETGGAVPPEWPEHPIAAGWKAR